MPYSRLDINLSDKKSEDSLQAALYQINVVLDNIVDEVKVTNPQYNRPSLFIESLGLTKDEHEQICDYFRNHSDGVDENKNWLTNWMQENVYEMPEEYVERMVASYQEWYEISYEEACLMPNHWQDIQLTDKKSEAALHAVLFQMNSVMTDIIAEIQSKNPNFQWPFQWEIGLTQDQSSLILRHFVFNRHEKLTDSINWLTSWLAENGFSVSQEHINRIVDNIRTSVKLMN
ncbi:hypothetical protein LASUN_11110 [Lentilactobacillus sunkii]|jgi:hypothetical protein|uniref:Uncharacterized protein n=1 Tax=Lentilactobacillus sunkii TaxID=481719 RepID=A0A1E7XDJ1_9LACO|nr:hypothetical protein [Lentilactobacillus sunkii]OFA11042.1 hypothetical protein LASUN_11110 [Lentilactobacillus sunkii]